MLIVDAPRPEFDLPDGANLDRFSRYRFTSFGGTSLNGFAGSGGRLRDSVLAALRDPSDETPAEIRMLRALGADPVTMSSVPEVIAARRLGLHVSALAGVANRGARTEGEGPSTIGAC